MVTIPIGVETLICGAVNVVMASEVVAELMTNNIITDASFDIDRKCQLSPSWSEVGNSTVRGPGHQKCGSISSR